ncbi:hypothetical protein [Streptomyces sp. NPDC001933]|uniref:hypothetical protein n=1 Tax=Streptomyces sp. NPDC001933 TaxID=3364626 RepID=UPI00369015D5
MGQQEARGIHMEGLPGLDVSVDLSVDGPVQEGESVVLLVDVSSCRQEIAQFL